MKWAQKQTGFTIVELLIVVVVIAILAAITIVAYNGIQNNAKESVSKNSVAQAVRKVEAFKVASGTETLPTTKAQIGLQSDAGLTLYTNATGGTYCVTASNTSARSYMATSFDSTVREGDCVNRNGLSVWLPMNGNANNDGSTGGVAWTVTGATLGAGQNGASNGSYQFGANTNLYRGVPQSYPAITGSAWVYLDSATGTPGLMNGNGGTQPLHWELSGGSWRVRLGAIDRVGIAPRGPLQTWSHVAFTYNRTSGLFEYYIDGVRVDSTTGDSGQNDYFPTGLSVGQSNGNARQWLGRIDDVRIYDRVLSEVEIKNLYSAGAL